MSINDDKNYRVVADKIIEQLKNGTSPWVKPWDVAPSIPINASTGKAYRGINVLSLMGEARSDSRWMTYKQAAAADYQVKKGSKGTPILVWKTHFDRDKKDASGNAIKDSNGKNVKESVKRKMPMLKKFTVFNAEQIDGIPPLEPKKALTDIEANERADGILKESGAEIRHGGGRAFYRPSDDFIQLPDKEDFTQPGAYYATALHELGHWSGHETRLDRDLTGEFGSPKYATEELRAEIYSFMASAELEIPYDPSQHLGYVDHWVKKLEDDPSEIMAASKDANTILEYTLAFDRTLKIEKEKEKEQMNEENPKVIVAKTGEESAESLDSDTVTTRVYSDAESAMSTMPAEFFELKGKQNTQNDVAASGVSTERVYRTNKYTGENAFMDMAVNAEKVAQFEKTPPEQRPSVSDVFPELSTQEREFLNTGVTPEQWDKMMVPVETPAVRTVDIVADLKRACEDHGLIMNSDPVFDKKFHRVPVEKKGDSKNRHGQYKAHPDGRPAAQIRNFHTGANVTWVSQVTKPLTLDEKRALAVATQKLKTQRVAKEERSHNHKARRVKQLLSVMPKASDDNGYLKTKGIKASADVYQDKRGRLVVPLTDVNGKPQTITRINSTGSFKGYMKGGKKSGGMHILGDPKQGDKILVAEGYSTANSVYEATGIPTVAAFDAGNLATVALAVQQAYVEATVFVVGDDDRENDRNVGRVKAEQAAAAVSTRAIFPKFGAGSKGSSDFNDLATQLRKTVGRSEANKAVRQQVEGGIRIGRSQEKQQSASVKSRKEKVNKKQLSRSR